MESKRRKDAVICIEYLITASPEFFGEAWEEPETRFDASYFKDSLDWLKKKHGPENVVASTIHLDESTPHMAVFVVPKTADGRLSAKDFVGGRKILAQMQTDFASEVGLKHGLERGQEMSLAVHKKPALIKAMTAEKVRLEKEVKALAAEIERLTKAVSDGGEAMAAANLDAENWVMRENLLKIRNEKIRLALVAAQGKSEKFEIELNALKSENIDLNNLVTVTKNELGTVQVDFNALNALNTELKIKNEGLLSAVEALKTELLVYVPREPSESEYSAFLESKKDLPRLKIEDVKAHVAVEAFGRFAVVSFRNQPSLVEFPTTAGRELALAGLDRAGKSSIAR